MNRRRVVDSLSMTERSAMKLFEQQAAFAKDVAKLINWINEVGMFCTLGEAMRSAEQAEIYAKEGKGIKDSLHCKRLAIDLNLFDFQGKYITDTKEYEEFGIYWESLNPLNRWGGRFTRPDGNHFERRDV